MPLYPWGGRIPVLPGDAWHLAEPRASPGDLEQTEVSCIPALCTVLPHFIPNLYGTFVLVNYLA